MHAAAAQLHLLHQACLPLSAWEDLRQLLASGTDWVSLELARELKAILLWGAAAAAFAAFEEKSGLRTRSLIRPHVTCLLPINDLMISQVGWRPQMPQNNKAQE
jgi:hypothetical protein